MSAPTAVLADVRASLGGLDAALMDGQLEQARLAHAAATRSLQALGILIGAAPAAVPVTFTSAEDRDVVFGKTGGCPRCGSKTKQASAGFGPAVSSLCGACGYDLEAA